MIRRFIKLWERPEPWVLLVAVLARLLYLATARSPALVDPLIDADYYDYLGERLSRGGGFPDPVFWQPPLYPLLLAGLYSALGHALLWPRLLQGALGALTAVLCCNIAERATGRRWVGGMAGLLVALHGSLIFYDGELLPTALATDLGILAVWLSLSERPSVARAVASGAAVGLGALAVAPTLLLALPIGWRMLRLRLAAGLCCIATCVACVLPVTLTNHGRSGEWILISANGGVNLWIGNNADIDRAVAIRPGAGWEQLMDEPARRGLYTPGQQDAYFVRKASRWCASEPWTCARNLAWKARLLLLSRELPRNESLAVVRKDSPVLAILSPELGGVALPYAVLLPLAAAGIALAFRERNRLLISVLAAAGMLALSPVVFFVTGRYRAPLAPLLCILAAAGLIELLARPRRWLSLGAAAAVLALSVWPVRLAVDSIDFESEMYFVVGGRRARLGDDAGAVAAWARALSTRPDYLEAGFNRALALERMGRMSDAAAAYVEVLRHHPEHMETRMRHALALLGAGDLSGAEVAFGALAGEPRTASLGLQGLAQVALARGDTGTAEALLAQAEERSGQMEEISELRRQIEERRRSTP